MLDVNMDLLPLQFCTTKPDQEHRSDSRVAAQCSTARCSPLLPVLVRSPRARVISPWLDSIPAALCMAYLQRSAGRGRRCSSGSGRPRAGGTIHLRGRVLIMARLHVAVRVHSFLGHHRWGSETV